MLARVSGRAEGNFGQTAERLEGGHCSVRTSRIQGMRSKTCDEVFAHLLSHGLTPDELHEALCKQKVEIVLTAHPTQVNRRTLQYKHSRIAALLAQNDR